MSLIGRGSEPVSGTFEVNFDKEIGADLTHTVSAKKTPLRQRNLTKRCPDGERSEFALRFLFHSGHRHMRIAGNAGPPRDFLIRFHDAMVQIIGQNANHGHEAFNAFMPILPHAFDFPAVEDLFQLFRRETFRLHHLRPTRNRRILVGFGVMDIWPTCETFLIPRDFDFVANSRTALPNHMIHHVMDHVTVENPITGIKGDELEITRLGHADKSVVARDPSFRRDASTFMAGNPEGVPV